MSDVTLSASVRQSLLSLQNTTSLVERTQNRLSTGLRVSSAIDDPVAFFQSKSLSDRASDFLEKKDGIDQGISTVTSALDGVESIEALVKQMKGISNAMKSATDSQISDLVSQFNDLRTQINNLAADATYQGANLINGTGQTLSVEFSERTASLLNVASVDLRSSTAGLNLAANAYTTADNFVDFSTLRGATAAGNEFQNRFLSTSDDFVLTYNGSDKTFSAGETVAFTFGTGSTFNFVNSTAQALTLSNAGTVTVNIVTAADQITGGQIGIVADQNINATFEYGTQTYGQTTAALGTATVTYQGSSTITLAAGEEFVFDLGGVNVTAVATSGFVLSQGKVIDINVLISGSDSYTDSASGLYFIATTSTAGLVATGADTTASNAISYGIALNGNATGTITSGTGDLSVTGFVKAGDTNLINGVIDQLDDALTTLRTQAQTLGSNVALLNTRLDFTEQYTNTLQGGADKLTLADINEEGANLLALQTRQQLGIQSLSLAAQAEASILSLFG